MAIVGVVTTGPSASLTLNFETLVTRVVNLLRRTDLRAEAELWVNFAQRELADNVDFPELRVHVYTDSVVEQYFYDLPADYSHMDDVFCKDMTASDQNGRHLVPLPRKFYANDVVDLERLLNMIPPTKGDPMYFWVQGSKLGVYPAPDRAFRFEMTYYQLPADLTYPTQEPAIANRWRHYLIWLTVFWGKAMIEQEDIAKVAKYESKFTKTIEFLKSRVKRTEDVREHIEAPSNGLEMADEIY